MTQPLSSDSPAASDDLAPSATRRVPSPSSVLWLVWKWYKSIQFGMFLLALIGAACIFGTMHYAANNTLGDNAIPLAKQKVFNSWWFVTLLAFFFVQFVTSTWHVTIMSLGIMSKRDFSKGRSFLTTGAGRAVVDVPGGPDAVEAFLARNFTRAHRSGAKFFAHRGMMSRIGPTVIHAGIVIILVAGLFRVVLERGGHILTEGRFAAVEGETSNTVFKPVDPAQVMNEFNLSSFQIPYEVKVLDFDEILHPNSTVPAYFSSLLEIRDMRTNEIRVARVDMNHSVSIAGYEFHQASYQPIPPIQSHRTNFDVRDAATGERIAISDASPETRVQVGDEDLYLEVDGEAPGDAWRMYNAQSPTKPIAEGRLLAKAGTGNFAFKPLKFYPDFAFDKEKGPHTASNEPNNPVLRVALMRDGATTGETLLFMDPEMNKQLPPHDAAFELRLVDIQVAGGAKADLKTVDWDDPAMSRFAFEVVRKDSGEVASKQSLSLNQDSEAVQFTAASGDEKPPAGARFAVYPVGRGLRYATILMVNNQPVTKYYTLGVAIIFIGAMLTFTGRYQAFHGEWDEKENRLYFALVPRFGKADPATMAALIQGLTGKPATEYKPASAESAAPAG